MRLACALPGLYVKNTTLHFPRPALFSALVSTLLATTLLSACGGGDYAASGATPPSVSPVTPGPVTPAAFTLTGTAATGAAIEGGNVTANCIVGTATGITAADGSFTLTLDKGQVAPCLLRVSKAASPPALAVELYGFAAAAGRVNITTLTDTSLTRALAASPADVFASFDAARATAINTALPVAISYVQAQFAAINLGTVPADLMTTAFVVGDYYDKLLDNIAVMILGAGKTYADWVLVAKNAGNLITVTTPLAASSSEITLPPTILALPYTGAFVFLKTVADTTGFAGSHVYGRGLRSNLQTSANPTVTYTNVSGCTLSVDGGDLVLAASGQTTRVSYTPRFLGSGNGVDNYSVSALVSPRNLYGNTSFVTFTGLYNAKFQADGIVLYIENGTVTNVIANNAATGTQTTCGSTVGSNLNTDRSLDVLSLPTTTLVSDLKVAATAKGLFTITRTVTTADLAGFGVNVNFGRGVYTTYNTDNTVKGVMSINDCKVGVTDGKLHMTSAQAAYDHSFLLTAVDFNNNGAFNNDQLQFRGNETASSLSASTRIVIDLLAPTPFVLSVEGLDFANAKNSLICPRG